MNNYDFKLDMESKNSLSVILSQIKRGSVVLEFGCANGRMSRYLKETLGCRVFGVEIDAVAAEASCAFMERMLIEDIGQLGWVKAFGDIEFDVIVFADVLEHLIDPLTVLIHAKELLREDGIIYVSVPNVTHNCIVMELFNEQFGYRDAGLLDSTHIRFFSYKSFKKLVAKSGLSVMFQDGISVVPELSEFGYRYEELMPCVAEFLEGREYGEIYQFVFGLTRDATLSVENNIICNASRRYAQVMVDLGEGYGEHIESVFIDREGERICLDFELGKYEKICGIRFDPLNRCVMVSLEGIVLYLESGESFVLGHSMSNAKLSHNKREYFTSFDPIYHLDLGGRDIIGAKRLEIVMSYKEAGYAEVVEEIIRVQWEILREQNQKFEEYREFCNRGIIMKFLNFINERR